MKEKRIGFDGSPLENILIWNPNDTLHSFFYSLKVNDIDKEIMKSLRLHQIFQQKGKKQKFFQWLKKILISAIVHTQIKGFPIKT